MNFLCIIFCPLIALSFCFECLQAVSGIGFHREKRIQLTLSPSPHPRSLAVVQEFPRELFVDKYQLKRYYSPFYFQLKNLQFLSYVGIWLSKEPDLEVPSVLAESFSAILYFAICPLPSEVHFELTFPFHGRYCEPSRDPGLPSFATVAMLPTRAYVSDDAEIPNITLKKASILVDSHSDLIILPVGDQEDFYWVATILQTFLWLGTIVIIYSLNTRKEIKDSKQLTK